MDITDNVIQITNYWEGNIKLKTDRKKKKKIIRISNYNIVIECVDFMSRRLNRYSLVTKNFISILILTFKQIITTQYLYIIKL